MTFNSYIFVLFFLPATVCGYFFLYKMKQASLAKFFLLVASWWFYSYFNYSYLIIIVASILFNFGLGKLFKKTNIAKVKRRLVLIFGLVVNLGVLFYFKYFDFFVGNINTLFQSDFQLLHVVLPLGISFFTFQQLSYVIDSYRAEVPNYNFLDYALFVSFFPQLVAGPIVLHSEIVPQFEDQKNHVFSYENFAKGITAFAAGLAKKVLIADTFGNMVNWGYANVGSLDTTNAMIVMLAYTIQIYFDFSGYCDMAMGIGLMFNIKIVQNFNSPYKALTIADFWKRWHITLTRFFTTYIYIPLGGNRKGTLRTYFNMFLVFFISGLWHGANWTFILWGSLHGVAVIINRIFKDKVNQGHPALNWLVTFGFLNVTWIYFRAPSIAVANQMIKSILKCNFGPILPDINTIVTLPEVRFLKELLHLTTPYFPVLVLMGGFLLSFFMILGARNTYERIDRFQPRYGIALTNALLLTWCIISFSSVSTFLYFNF